MRSYSHCNITWESDPYVILIDDHPALFAATWEYDADLGWLVQAEFVETRIGAKIWTRDDLLAMSTESAVAEVERAAGQHFVDNWRMYLEAANLAWGTYAENEADKRRHGTWDTRRNGKLSELERNAARLMRANGISQAEIADCLGVSRPTITRLLNGSTWS